MKRFWLALGPLLPWLGSAAELPQPVLPAGVGVNIHFATGHQRDLNLIAAAGFKFVRMDFSWAATERVKGEYQWADYEQLLTNLDQRGLRAVLILDYSNPLYEPTVSSTNPLTHLPHQATAAPQHPESVAAFARWAAAAANHFHGRHVLWEIWNEPNIQFWTPKPDVEQYSTLALAAAKAIRAAEPQATIVGPASSGFPWPFLESFFQSGILAYLDAVSVHPYRGPHTPPETAAADYQRLRELIARYAPASRQGKIPILSGEWGYSTFRKGVSLETQAAFAARQQLINLLNGVPLSIWYDWKNDGTNPDENEDNFGTVQNDLQPKPAYLALQTLAHELAGYQIARRLPVGEEKDYLLVCTNAAAGQKLVAWTTGEPHEVSVSLSPANTRELQAAGGLGEPLMLSAHSGQLKLALGALPQYVALGGARIKSE